MFTAQEELAKAKQQLLEDRFAFSKGISRRRALTAEKPSVGTKRVAFTAVPTLDFNDERITNAKGPSKFFEVASLAQKHKLAILAKQLDTVKHSTDSKSCSDNSSIMYRTIQICRNKLLTWHHVRYMSEYIMLANMKS